jgi:hypothetical protein
LNFGFSDLFHNGKICGLGPRFMDHSFRPVHGGLHGGADGETTGERLGRRSGLPVLTDGGWEGKGGMGDAPRGSPELGERWSGQATRVNWWRWQSSVGGGCSDVGEEERGMVSGVDCSKAEVPHL